MPNDYDRETTDGRKLVVSKRTVQVNVKLGAGIERLWKVQAQHQRRRLNDLLPQALRKLDAEGLSEEPYTRNLASGLRKPKRIISCTAKTSPEELALLDRLARQYGLSRARVVGAALMELDRDDPAPLTPAGTPRPGSGGAGGVRGQAAVDVALGGGVSGS